MICQQPCASTNYNGLISAIIFCFPGPFQFLITGFHYTSQIMVHVIVQFNVLKLQMFLKYIICAKTLS